MRKALRFDIDKMKEVRNRFITDRMGNNSIVYIHDNFYQNLFNHIINGNDDLIDGLLNRAILGDYSKDNVSRTALSEYESYDEFKKDFIQYCNKFNKHGKVFVANLNLKHWIARYCSDKGLSYVICSEYGVQGVEVSL